MCTLDLASYNLVQGQYPVLRILRTFSLNLALAVQRLDKPCKLDMEHIENR